MGRTLKPTLHYKSKGGQPYYLITISCSAPTNGGVFTSDLVKTWALSLKTCLGGIPHLIGPQHKHHDSPSSHSVGVAISMGSLANLSWATRRSAMHWAVVCWACSIRSSQASLSGELIYCNVYIPYICVCLPLIFVVMVKASLIHG